MVDDPLDAGHTITDIDRIQDGVLWEEKSATYAPDPAKWAQKQVTAKIDKYLEARTHLPGYQDAPIGLHFTTAGADPAFKAAVEAAVEAQRVANPGVTIVVRWTE